jgi:hypothetical protein
MLETGAVATAPGIAAKEKINESYVSRVPRLSPLARHCLRPIRTGKDLDSLVQDRVRIYSLSASTAVAEMRPALGSKIEWLAEIVEHRRTGPVALRRHRHATDLRDRHAGRP